MVVLRSSLLFIASSLLFFSSCTNDQLVEIVEQPPVIVGPNHLIGTWELDSVKITTKEHPVEDGVAYEVLVWHPNPDEKDTLTIDESFFTWTRYNNSYGYSVDSLWLNVYNQDTSRFVIKNSTAQHLSFSLFGVYENPSNSGEKKREFGSDSLRIDSVYYFSNPTYYEVSFASDIYEEIFYRDGSGKCMPCHGSGTPYPLELQPINVAYTSLIYGYSTSGEAYVDTTNPHLSHLYKRVVGEGAAIMPPESNDNGSLSAQEVELIYLWIQQGAKNN